MGCVMLRLSDCGNMDRSLLPFMQTDGVQPAPRSTEQEGPDQEAKQWQRQRELREVTRERGIPFDADRLKDHLGANEASEYANPFEHIELGLARRA